jgi:hypothetical protein
MPLHDETLDRATVRHVLDDTVAALQRDDTALRESACEALGVGSDDWARCRDELIEDLLQADDWIDREEALAAQGDGPVDSEDGPEFIPSHPTLALLQSAMEERLATIARHAFQPRDPGWLSVVYHRLRARVRGKAPFIEHARLDDFRVDLPERATVALVSDWGTGNAHAVAVAQQIAAKAPDHVIHLGDIYYSGTPYEVETHFLNVWRVYGPRAARYWSLNANHDMYSGGYGYFQHLLPAFGQPASYFALGNPWWRLVGLDTGYVTHTFTTPQMAWLDAQAVGPAQTILLTHHHLLSRFRRRGDALEEWLDPYFLEGRIHAWFWGHEHHLIEYPDYRGVKCRCIGHGALPYIPPDRLRVRHPVDVVRWETRLSPLSPTRGMHGFALLRFDGPVLHIEYVDEVGGTAWTERWP